MSTQWGLDPNSFEAQRMRAFGLIPPEGIAFDPPMTAEEWNKMQARLTAPPTVEYINPVSVAMTWTGDRIVGATERRPDGTVITWGTHRPRAERRRVDDAGPAIRRRVVRRRR